MVHHRNLKSQDPTGSAVDVIKFKVNATIKQFETCTKELINYVFGTEVREKQDGAYVPIRPAVPSV